MDRFESYPRVSIHQKLFLFVADIRGQTGQQGRRTAASGAGQLDRLERLTATVPSPTGEWAGQSPSCGQQPFRCCHQLHQPLGPPELGVAAERLVSAVSGECADDAVPSNRPRDSVSGDKTGVGKRLVEV